jgi:hypothetical protein
MQEFSIMKYLMRKKIKTICLAALCLCAANAQPTIEKKTQTLFPMVPFIIEYEYAPNFFAQWVAGHAQYSRIEAVVDNLDKAATIQIILIEKESGKRIFYCTSEAQVKTFQAEGKEVYLTKIDFKTAQQADRQPTYGFGFRDKSGQAILWRVIPATRPSERGGGLTPLGSLSGLRLEHRDLGTAVGEGTAIQIGETVIEAEPWKEISAPPYFIAYRGTVAIGRHYGSLLLGAKKWRVASRPAELKEGAEWTLSDERGNKRVFKITARNNGELIISEQGTNSTLMSFTVHTTDSEGFVLRSVRLNNNSQTMQIKFEPELSLNPTVSGKFETNFTISQGKYDKIVSGTISVERTGGNLRWRLIPKSPDWTKSRILETLIKSEPDGYSIETTQTAK